MGFDEDFFLNGEHKDMSLIDRFMYCFLELKDLPGKHLTQLKNIVRNDLDTINETIAKYESLEFIQQNTTPRNQKQNTQQVFYQRCLEERG
jgi:hypothetical protein